MTNDDKYRDNAEAFLRALILYIDRACEEQGVSGNRKRGIVEAASWNVASLLDGSANIPTKQKAAVIPRLYFLSGKNKPIISDEFSLTDLVFDYVEEYVVAEKQKRKKKA